MNRSLLQQLLSNIKREQLGRVSRLSTCSTAGVSAENSGGEPVCTAAMTAVGPHLDDGASTSLGLEQQQSEQQKQLCKATSIGMGAGLASEWPEPADLPFSDEDIARFQAGLRKCLTGVLQIKVSYCQKVMLARLITYRQQKWLQIPVCRCMQAGAVGGVAMTGTGDEDGR